MPTLSEVLDSGPFIALAVGIFSDVRDLHTSNRLIANAVSLAVFRHVIDWFLVLLCKAKGLEFQEICIYVSRK